MINIKALNERLAKEGAKWRAVESSISRLSTKQFKRMLGWVPDPSVLKTEMTTDWSKKKYKWAPGDNFDQVVDWRNKNGKNYVSPVQDQGACGSCVAFAVAGLVESMALIEKGILLNLSESDLAFCGSHASDCGSWGQGGAFNDLMKRGTVTANKFPYLSAFPSENTGNSPTCQIIPNHDNYSVKITASANIYDISARKSYLTNVGPVVAGITVYNDFSPAPGMIYSPSQTAKKTGGHCILIIGYSEIEKYWLCKNSWGTDWGDKGFCKIAYGACDIDIETATEKTYYTNCDGVIIPDVVIAELVENKGLDPLSNVPAAICCEGFFSDDDNMRHAIVANVNGDITEIFFNPQSGLGKSILTNQHDLIDLGAFYTDDDKFRHVIILTGNGNVSEIFYSPTSGLGVAPLANIPGAIKVCGFFSSDDNNRHAIVASADGSIFEIFYGNQGKGQSKIGSFDNVIDVCCFYSPDDSYRHAVVATANGDITEIFFNPQTGISNAFLVNIPGTMRLSSFFAANTNFYNRRIQVLTADHNIYELRYDAVNGLVKNLLNNTSDAIDLGGFFSSDDNMAHCIFILKSGDIKELFYSQ